MVAAWERRRQTELLQDGIVIAYAMGDPEKLPEQIARMFRPAPRPSDDPAQGIAGDPGEGEFVKRWWDVEEESVDT